jgi:hypothetical protein
LIDVSDDLVEGSMVRRSDGVSTFQFSMNNERRKYDLVFAPNDRIVVSMKRITWVRVFTGLLNSVPLVTAWPKVVNVTASCSLKRLQYWFWDPNTSATQEMIRQALSASNLDPSNSDGGITNVVLNILAKVVGWPEAKVHIARIPADWFKIAYKIAQQVEDRATEADRLAAEFGTTLGASGVIAGQALANGARSPLAAGTYNGESINDAQAANAFTICQVGTDAGLSLHDLITAYQESRWQNLPGGDRDSVGLFQQRPSQGWGTAAQCQDPKYAAGKFYEALGKIGNRASLSVTQAAQAVQRSGFPDAYAKWEPLATQAATTITQAGSLSTNNQGTFGNVTSGGDRNSALTTIGAATGLAFAKAAVKLVTDFPRIPYYEGNPNHPEQNPPPRLDCSSFVQAIWIRVTGGQPCPRVTTEQVAWCQKAGMARLSATEGMKTPGALMFKGDPSGHVEVSVGDGVHTVGSHSGGTFASVIESANYWDYAYMMPGLTYPASTGTGLSLAELQALSSTSPGTSGAGTTAEPGFNPKNPFDALFGATAWQPQTPQDNHEMALAEALTGIRALLNDQALLPYLKNLFNATQRSFSSAPNGDLIAWFPDYYGLWGTAGKMVLQPIEIMDFDVTWSDDYFVTHQFTLAGQLTYLDIPSGGSSTNFATGDAADIKTETLGIASIDIPAVMYGLFGVEATEQEGKDFAAYIYKRFGARPDYTEVQGIIGKRAEFFSALYLFTQQWAYQYNADIPLTFMPELWPGMLVQIPDFDFQAYVTTVSHTFQFGKGGGFRTTINIAAPARLPKSKGDKSGNLIGLPLAGDYQPGVGIGKGQTKTPAPATPVPEAQQFARLASGKRIPL